MYYNIFHIPMAIPMAKPMAKKAPSAKICNIGKQYII